MARILVADDEEGIREFIAEVLEDEDHEVMQASDGAEAAAQLEDCAFDLVVTDLKMPKMDGLQLLARVKELEPDTEVVMLTAHGSIDSAVEAMKLGAFDFLSKPLSGPAELRLLAERALERRRLRGQAALVTRSEPDELPLSYGAPAMDPVVRALEKVAPTDATVLLTGESGAGKEVAARALHRWSKRASGPFVAINCAALSESLLESELFGHEKGAFTGATELQRGRIELAAGGTFFLDEIGELKLELQAKLLRVLQDRKIERVGGRRSIAVDVRWVAATNRDLEAMIDAGGFREDLYHRLALFPIALPPLRERPQDIVPLAEQLLVGIGGRLNRAGLSLSDEAKQALKAAPWRGNVRELANALERAAILADGSKLERDDVMFGTRGAPAPSSAPPSSGAARSLEESERDTIEHALASTSGNRREAAEILGVPIRTLYHKLKKHDLS